MNTVRRSRRVPRVVDSQGMDVTQDAYNALMRSVANLSELAVHLEDKIDRLREGLALIKECSDGRSRAWTLAYEALNDLPYSPADSTSEPGK